MLSGANAAIESHSRNHRGGTPSSGGGVSREASSHVRGNMISGPTGLNMKDIVALAQKEKERGNKRITASFLAPSTAKVKGSSSKKLAKYGGAPHEDDSASKEGSSNDDDDDPVEPKYIIKPDSNFRKRARHARARFSRAASATALSHYFLIAPFPFLLCARYRPRLGPRHALPHLLQRLRRAGGDRLPARGSADPPMVLGGAPL